MKILAYFDSSHEFPEEIAMAAGFTPFKIMGDVHAPNDLADQYLQGFLCPAARSFLTEAIKDAKKWAGIIVACGCYATNRFFDVWRMHVDTKFIYWFNNPMNTNATAAKFFKLELKRLIEELEAQFNIKIKKENIRDAIKLSNSIKKKLQQLSALRSVKDITNAEYFQACLDAIVKDKSTVLSELDGLVKAWENRPDFPRDKKRALLTGSEITYVEWMELLDDTGIRVVRDDLSIGERYFASLIPEKDDPLDSIVEYHFSIPRPATKNPPDPRLDFLLKALKDTPVDLVISQNLKFCEVYAFDAVWIVNELKKHGYKTMHLEREFTPMKDLQTINRLEAFIETL
ncbi:MAG: 2-hydroxyacyl-CoA dehydratase subunit D [Promethearchaeota archaeon]